MSGRTHAAGSVVSSISRFGLPAAGEVNRATALVARFLVQLPRQQIGFCRGPTQLALGTEPVLDVVAMLSAAFNEEFISPERDGLFLRSNLRGRRVARVVASPGCRPCGFQHWGVHHSSFVRAPPGATAVPIETRSRNGVL